MNCIAYQNPKLAALLFDTVVPVPTISRFSAVDFSGPDFASQFHREFYENAHVKHLNAVLPPEITEGHLALMITLSMLCHLKRSGGDALRTFMADAERDGGPLAQLVSMLGADFVDVEDADRHWQEVLKAAVLSKVPSGSEVFGTCEEAEIDRTSSSPFLQLTEFPLVDASAASWEQILEIRKDKESVRKLRRFRAFFLDTYAEKSVSQIEDDLLTRLGDHEEAARKAGLETVKAVFSVGGSQRFLSAAGGGAIASLLGAPGAFAAGISASVMLGGVLVQVVARRKLFELEQQADPVRYLADLRVLQDRSQSNANGSPRRS